MCKTIRKVLFGDLHNIQEYEEYFSEMSRMGLHLKEVGMLFASFEKGNPQYLNYRIDIVKKDDKEEIVNKHKDKGWNFVDQKDSILIFSSPVGSGLKELYETPEAQKLALRAARKDVFGGTLTKIVVVLIAVFLLILAGSTLNGFYLSLTREEIGLSFIVTLISFLRERRRERTIKKIERILDSGVFLSHSGDYQLMKSKSIARKALFNIFILLVLGIMIYKVYESNSINLSDIDNLDDLPMVTIADIEPMEYRPDYKKTFDNKDNIDYGNVLHESWSLFIPKEYTLVESGTLYDENNNKTDIKPRLTVDYYVTRFDFIAKGLERDILSNESKWYDFKAHGTQGEKDIIYYSAIRNDSSILIYRKEKQVIFLRYRGGTVSVEEVVKAVAEKLNLNTIVKERKL